MKKFVLPVVLLFIIPLASLHVEAVDYGDPGLLSGSLDGESVGYNNPEMPGEGSDFRIFWKEGLRLETADKNFSLKIGGRIMNDWSFFSEDNDINNNPAIGNLDDGTEFRRARFYMEGTIYKNVIYKAQYDFAGQDADFKDVYLGLTGLSFVDHIKVGHFKEPFSLEELTSSKYITFLERSLPNVFSPGRNTGLGVDKSELEGDLNLAAGIFRTTPDSGNVSEDGAFAFTGRAAFVPWKVEKDKLVHVGAAYSYRVDHSGQTRYRQRPEAHQTPRFADTGTFTTDSVSLTGLELAGVYGPFSLQGEYMFNDTDVPSGDDPVFHGYYVYGSFFVTGEHRPYKHGSFGRVKPLSNFLADGGTGALELTLRYSTLDLDSKMISGNELSDVTLGCNWYLNPNVRVMFNYVQTNVDLDASGVNPAGDTFGDGKANLYLMRFQIDF